MLYDHRDHIRGEDSLYLIYDTETGQTQLINSLPSNLHGKFFRRVRDTKEERLKGFEKELFKDSQFRSEHQNIENIDPNKGKVVWRRLQHLYPKKHRPQFFPHIEELTKVKDPSAVPHALIEIGLLPVTHYKSFFITQDFNENGRYLIVLNSQGRFETQVCDDYIPVYETNEQPIWDMKLDFPWELILMKVWAKRCGGYQNVKNTMPMDFLETFSNSNWKYYNLTKEDDFIKSHAERKWAQIVVKTKDNAEVRRSGLTPNEAAYYIVDIKKNEPENHDFTVVIKSTIKNKWSGTMSVVDKRTNTLGSNLKHTVKERVNLDKDIFVNRKDFYNLFASAYITSKRPHAISSYKFLDIKERTKNAFYLEFCMQKDGFLDFCIKQAPGNLRKPGKTSRVVHKEYQEGKDKKIDENQVQRYQKCKYSLIFNVKKTKQQMPYALEDDENKPQNQLNSYELSRRERRLFERQYNPLDYETYEIEYEKGYNQGEAHFINVEKGWYLIRIKAQYSETPTNYVFNYTTNVPINVREIDLSNEVRSSIMRQVAVSVSDRVPNVFFDKEQTECLGLGNGFDDIGYGFISIQSKKSSKYNILVQVNPQQLNESGYTAKDQFKHIKEPYGIVVEPGECTAIVLKKIENFVGHSFPPVGIKFFKKVRTG